MGQPETTEIGAVNSELSAELRECIDVHVIEASITRHLPSPSP
jgi:hypothetical protein